MLYSTQNSMSFEQHGAQCGRCDPPGGTLTYFICLCKRRRRSTGEEAESRRKRRGVPNRGGVSMIVNKGRCPMQEPIRC